MTSPVLCHDPTRQRLNAFSQFAIPDLREAAVRYIEAARLTNPSVRLAGVSLNTSMLSSDARLRVLAETAQLLDVPCFDPLQTPLDSILNRMALP
ncbi:MAG: DUF1611 domain-containing protein [Steroidobacteraceae bacterium]